MKVAIIGQGVIALKSFEFFREIGAHPLLFKTESYGGSLFTLSKLFPVELKQFTHEWNEKFFPLIPEAVGHSLNGRVVRVQKSKLDSKTPRDRRMSDTFKIVWEVDPKELLEENLKNHNEEFMKLGPEVIHSLGESLETFSEVDLVVDARGKFSEPLPMGTSHSEALNEKKIRQTYEGKKLFYGNQFLKNAASISFIENKGTPTAILFYGAGFLNALNLLCTMKILLNFPQQEIDYDDESLLKELSNRPFQITIISKTSHFFKDLSQEEKSWIHPQLEKAFDLLTRLESFEKDQFYKARENSQEKSQENSQSESPYPEPYKRLVFIKEEHVISLDKLIDHDEIFVTLEPIHHGENEPNSHRTIKADVICVDCGYRYELPREFGVSNTLASGLYTDEPGYFDLRGVSLESWPSQRELMMNEILQFFSPRNSENLESV